MLESQVKQLLIKKFDSENITIIGEGCDFSVIIVSDLFTGLRAVQRQKIVYECLHDLISSGQLHAISIKALTPSENSLNYTKASSK